MQPIVTELFHDASVLIDAYSQEGFPADSREDWTVYHIEAEMQIGPHPSDNAKDSTKALHYETSDKVATDIPR